MPASQSKQASLEEDLTTMRGADEIDADLLGAARRLAEAVRTVAPDVEAAIGVDLQRVEAESLLLERIYSGGGGVRAQDIKVKGAMVVRDVHGGEQGDASKGP
jgi:hypothetical protein